MKPDTVTLPLYVAAYFQELGAGSLAILSHVKGDANVDKAREVQKVMDRAVAEASARSEERER